MLSKAHNGVQHGGCLFGIHVVSILIFGVGADRKNERREFHMKREVDKDGMKGPVKGVETVFVRSRL